MSSPAPFRFHSRTHLVTLLGRKARSVTELLEAVREVPPASIYFHTHHFLQQHHYLSPEPPNDFALWVGNALNLEHLAESLASVDIVSYNRIELIREAIAERLAEYLDRKGHQTSAATGREFHCMSCQTFIVPTSYVASGLRQFCDQLALVNLSTLYFHVFEAPLRLKRDENDFSAWFRTMGQPQLAAEISTFDPYSISLERLRRRLIATVSKYA